MSTLIHKAPPEFFEHPVKVALIGCGGNGAQMLTGLARLDRAVRALGGHGLTVTAWDGDSVSTANVGRQLFYPADVGTNKAVTLVTRLNAGFGLNWEARPEHAHANNNWHCRPNLVISCVDSASARLEIGRCLQGNRNNNPYWLDLGNRAEDGQVVLGLVHGVSGRQRLPHVLDLFPEIAAGDVPDDDAPSCSLAEALERQALFVNDAVVTQAKEILWRLFRTGELGWHGAFVNTRLGRVTPLAVDPDAWARFNPALNPHHRKSRKGNS